MPTRSFRMLAALCGSIGVPILVAAFIVNPGVPAGDTIAQAIGFDVQHHNAILIGAWMQEIGSFLSVAFALAIVFLAGAQGRIAGWLTLLGGTILLFVGIAEVTFYLLVDQGSTSNDPATVAIGLGLIQAVQHAYSMIAAPAVFFPLAAVILGARVLPGVFGYLALALGAAFLFLGLIVLFNPLQQVLVNDLAGIQAFWFLGAAITMLLTADKRSGVALPADAAMPTRGQPEAKP